MGNANTARTGLCLGSWVPKGGSTGGTPNGQGRGRTAGHSPMAPRCAHLTSFLQGPQPSGVWGCEVGTRPPSRDWVRAGAELGAQIYGVTAAGKQLRDHPVQPPAAKMGTSSAGLAPPSAGWHPGFGAALKLCPRVAPEWAGGDERAVGTGGASKSMISGYQGTMGTAGTEGTAGTVSCHTSR